MDESIKLAFQFARDLAVQLITLSTGVLALSITFNKEVVKDVPRAYGRILWFSWGFFFFSILCGIWTTMALTGSLESFNKDEPIGTNVRFPAGGQIISFFVAIILLIVYGVLALSYHAKPPDGPPVDDASPP
jgi:hypothetical protein